MHECLLCKRDMSKVKDTFGKGCINNIYKFLNINAAVKLKNKEKFLYQDIMAQTGYTGLNNKQKIWLTDRYLTYRYLSVIKYGNFDKIKKEIKEDIENINKVNKFGMLTTVNKITLKDAYDMYKKQNKFESNLKKLKRDKFDIDEVKIFNFIFRLYQKQNAYQKLMSVAMQYAFWELVILGGKIVDFDFSAELLKHSFNSNPNDLYITEGDIIEKIKQDYIFSSQIRDIIKEIEMGKKDNINIDTYITLSNSDLFFSINNADLSIKGVKNNEKWNLKIRIHDIYDYTKLKTIKEYYNSTNSTIKSTFASTLYNFAYFSMKADVLNEFDVYIDFEINNYEV